jgi:orotate phosphoribosyltransferase
VISPIPYANRLTDNELKNALVSLLKEKSLKLGDFTLASGKKSTYYVDARRTTMSAAGQQIIGDFALSRLRARKWTPDCVGGLTLGADPVAYAVAHASRRAPPSIDAFTVRKEAKTHGTGQLIEGCFEPGDRVVIIEDVFTTGNSALRAVEAVRAAGGVVIGVLGVVDRQQGGIEALTAAGLESEALATIHDLGVKP